MFMYFSFRQKTLKSSHVLVIACTSVNLSCITEVVLSLTSVHGSFVVWFVCCVFSSGLSFQARVGRGAGWYGEGWWFL